MGFQSVLVDGLFYKKGDVLLVKRDSDPEPFIVDDELEKLIDQKIQITVHHWPPTPVIQDRWGGGCCMWEPLGECPAGHHKNPAFLLNFSASGILRHTDTTWGVEIEKSIETIPLDMMDGHIGRIVAVTLIDASTFSDFNLDDVDLDVTADPSTQAAQMERIEGQTQQLRGMMGEFMDLLKEIKKGE